MFNYTNNDTNKLNQLLVLSETSTEQRTTDWYTTRKKYLTSSDLGSVLGLNKYETRETVLFKKCGMSSNFKENVATQHGNYYEQEAINMYCSITNRTSFSLGLVDYSTIHGQNNTIGNGINLSFLAGSVDGISVLSEYPTTSSICHHESILSVLEVKCPYRRKIIHGQIPEYYYPQIQMNMHILDIPYGDYVEYIPKGLWGKKECEMNIVRVYKDDQWLYNVTPVLYEFWNDVLYYTEHGIHNHPKYTFYLNKYK